MTSLIACKNSFDITAFQAISAPLGGVKKNGGIAKKAGAQQQNSQALLDNDGGGHRVRAQA